jgi:hypothetical protein
MNKRVAAVVMIAVGGGFGNMASANDYPTSARVDYVLACMSANGQSQEVMLKCSCSIDAIAEEIPYADYTALETVKVMAEGAGERGGLFRNLAWAQVLMDKLRKAQVAADLQCF